jgi:class I fructose-bisphosphate aldolase
VDEVDYHTAADLTGQANHLGVTLQADIIKQKLPTNNGGYLATKHGKTHKLVYDKLTTDHPIDLTRYQVLTVSAAGRSDQQRWESKGESDLQEAVTTAVINKRAGGMGLSWGASISTAV